jgi:predicted TIM-barrel fold metal-dependent hydrolase
VKISGAYRLSADPEMKCVRAMARELMSVAPTRLVFATDWPHTQFDGLDIMPFIEECLSWSRAGSGLRERLFRRNAEELWDVQGTDENFAQRL